MLAKVQTIWSLRRTHQLRSERNFFLEVVYASSYTLSVFWKNVPDEVHAYWAFVDIIRREFDQDAVRLLRAVLPFLKSPKDYFRPGTCQLPPVTVDCLVPCPAHGVNKKDHFCYPDELYNEACDDCRKIATAIYRRNVIDGTTVDLRELSINPMFDFDAEGGFRYEKGMGRYSVRIGDAPVPCLHEYVMPIEAEIPSANLPHKRMMEQSGVVPNNYMTRAPGRSWVHTAKLQKKRKIEKEEARRKKAAEELEAFTVQSTLDAIVKKAPKKE
jgi:hypothetical protein